MAATGGDFFSHREHGEKVLAGVEGAWYFMTLDAVRPGVARGT